jgi:hypothetical protein
MNIKYPILCLSLISSNASLSAANDPVEALFTSIYKTNFWQSKESVSGPGSEYKVTCRMRNELSALIKRFGIISIVDAPCGDFNWMRHVDMATCKYTGFDIVQELIERNNSLFGNDVREFKHLNLIDGIIDKSDLIICRDMLAHLTDEQIYKVLRNFKASGSKYILMTTNYASQENTTIEKAGDWRKLNLELAPFNFPRPLAIIAEDVPFDWERGKHLALWFLDDLNV